MLHEKEVVDGHNIFFLYVISESSLFDAYYYALHLLFDTDTMICTIVASSSSSCWIVLMPASLPGLGVC